MHGPMNIKKIIHYLTHYKVRAYQKYGLLFFKFFLTNVAVESFAFLLHVRELSDSNLRLKTGHSETFFLYFLNSSGET